MCFVPRRTTFIVCAAAAAISSHALAAGFATFTPLSSSAGPIPVGDPLEATPITLSNPVWTQQSIADRTTQNTLVPNSNSGSWDMITANESGPGAGRYLFMPFETGAAGVQRIDLHDANYNTRTVTIVAPGTAAFVSGDASRWTPFGSYLTAEESWGTGSTKGRLFEVTNPTTSGPNGGTFVQRAVIPRVSHEGLAFDNAKNLYFVDELNGGTIYKYVPTNPNAADGNTYFASGQTFALRVGAGGQDENVGGPISGAFTWQPITNATGGALAGVSVVNADGTIDGRATADVPAVLSTGFNRPEDMEIQTLPSGQQRIYFTTTDVSSNGGTGRVYNLNLATGMISLFADGGTNDLATNASVAGAFRNPDNLGIDADGHMYIVEDRSGGVDDDIWIAMDTNFDGDLLDAGEGIARWASNGTQGSEFTGLYFDKFDVTKAYVNIQHPSSGNDRTIAITVPEPASCATLLAGVIGLATRRRPSA
jgi:secreted PhoX family phosphatase